MAQGMYTGLAAEQIIKPRRGDECLVQPDDARFLGVI